MYIFIISLLSLQYSNIDAREKRGFRIIYNILSLFHVILRPLYTHIRSSI